MVIPKWLKNYITQGELEAVEAHVHKIEMGTEAEIVPVIVKSSSEYPQTRVTLVLAGLLVFTIFWEAFGMSLHWDAFYTSLGLGVFGLILGVVVLPRLAAIPVVRRVFTARAEEFEQCFKRAQIEFYQNRLHHTKDGVGVLVFISMLEHSVIVLADKSVSDVLPPETWQRVVDEIIKGIKTKKMASGLEKGLEACSDLLIKHFPVKSVGKNELPNKVVIKE